MSCTAALGLHYALNCTIFDATGTAVFSPDGTIIATVTRVLFPDTTPVFSPDSTNAQVPLIRATVAPAFIPGSTHSRYISSPAHAGLPHTNAYICDHVFITILLTPDLLSSRPG